MVVTRSTNRLEISPVIGQSGAALFAGSASEFIEMAPASRLTAHLQREFSRRWGTATDSEVLAWRNSLTALAKVADAADVDTSGVGVELRLPLSSKRVDASLVGRNAEGRPTVLLVELKQWERVEPSTYPDNVIVGLEEHLHPGVQVAAYADYLRDSHSAFTEDGFDLQACAYLHNLQHKYAGALKEPAFLDLQTSGRSFLRGEEPALARLIEKEVGGGDGPELLPSLIHGRFSPSKKLIECVATALNESSVWTLLDEQRLAYNFVVGTAARAAKTEEKSVLIVLGGPGTGKSVIAAHLLIELSREGYRVAHSTASKAFTTNLRALGPAASTALFRWNFSFAHRRTSPNELDVLIVDEAHRLRKTSNMRYTPRNLRSEMSQARELVRAAKVSVFFLDGRQNVRPDEIGSVEEIEEGAAEEGASISTIELTGQFRCSGSTSYIDWVERLVSDSPTTPGACFLDGEYDFRVFDSPQELEGAIKERVDKGDTGRLVAGFCWPWSDPAPDGSLVDDVSIGDWRRPWNPKPPEQQRPPKPAPRPSRHPYTLWASRPEGLDQVGCIYSAQGFEFDYCGVILGDDFVWREGVGWDARREESKDPQIKRLKDREAVRALVENAYRVLLTRGMKGTYVYATSVETRTLLRRMLATESH